MFRDALADLRREAFLTAGLFVSGRLFLKCSPNACARPRPDQGTGAGTASGVLPVGQQYLRSMARTLSAMSGRFSAWASVASMKPTLSPQS